MDPPGFRAFQRELEAASAGETGRGPKGRGGVAVRARRAEEVLVGTGRSCTFGLFRSFVTKLFCL